MNIMNYIATSLYLDFKCSGGACPYTCCSGSWEIPLTDEEITAYLNLEHPFRDELLSYIDRDKKCLKAKKGKCTALTEDGWCKLVLACGEKILSKTCEVFPRSIKRKGNIVSFNVEIACPEVALRLFEEEEILFGGQKGESDECIEAYNHEILDSLYYSRNWLIDDIQKENNLLNIYTIFYFLEEMRELWEQDKLNYSNTFELCTRITEQRSTHLLLCEKIAMIKKDKIDIIQKFISDIMPDIIELIKDSIALINDHMRDIEKHVKVWCSNSDILTEDVAGFREYFTSKYPTFIANYLVYSIYEDWICMEKSDFGKNIYGRYIELAVDLILMMSIWKSGKYRDTIGFSVIISWMNRIFCHNYRNYTKLYNGINSFGKENIAYLMLLLIL